MSHILQYLLRVLSRNVLFSEGGEADREKCALGRGLSRWGNPHCKMLVCLYLSTSIHQSLQAGKSFLVPIFCIAIGKKIEGRGEA